MTSPFLIIAFSMVLAQTVEGSIAQYGIAGAVLAWLMLRVEKRLERMEDKVRDLCLVLSLDLISREHTETKLRDDAIQMAVKLRAEIDAKKNRSS